MSNRNRGVAPLIPHSGQRQNGKVESKPVGDHAKLVYKDVLDPMYAAANALNVALNKAVERVVVQVAKMDGVDLKTHVLNVDTMEWVPRPQEMMTSDAATRNPSG